MQVFAFDHRAQLEQLPGASPERIGAFKRLCLEAALKVQGGRRGYGILCDGRLGADALYAAEGRGLWIGRPVEWPGSRPLTLEPALGPDCGGLSEWPRDQVVKVLCFCHPDDDEAMWADQEATVLRLSRAARRNRLELLLEVIPSKVGPIEADTTARIIERFYDLGVYPDWWKLEPSRPKRNGGTPCRRSSGTTAHPRRSCSGLDAPEDELAASFALAARFPLVQGLRRRPHHLRPGGARLARRPSRRRSRRRDDGAKLCALPHLGRGPQRGDGGGSMSETIRLTAAQAMVKWLSVR